MASKDKAINIKPIKLEDLIEESIKFGRREVVEWIETHEESLCMDCLCAYDFRKDEWQAKLKEWGIR